MFDFRHYVPLLKGKEGEFVALSNVDHEQTKNIIPLIEVPPIDWDYENEKLKKNIDDHLFKLPSKISTAWGNERILFIDLLYVEPDEKTSDGNHPVSHLMEKLRDQGVKAIPVTAISRSDDFQEAVKDVVAIDNRGVCLRVFDFDCDDLVTTKQQIDALLSLFKLTPADCDIIIDLRSNPSVDEAEVSKYIAIFKSFPYLDVWRTFTLAGSSFPESLADIQKDSSRLISRNEFKLWKLLLGNSELPRRPSFGDYGIAHPVLNDVDPRTMRMSANLRYTVENDWFILKAKDARRYGFNQFNGLCRKLVAHTEYRGAKYSWADEAIFACSLRNDKPGNASTWRALGTNQHLVFVAFQVANQS